MGKLRPYRFGTSYASATVLPQKMPVWDFGSGNVYLPLIDIAGGRRYTSMGSTRARPQAESLTYSAYTAYTSVSDLENGIAAYTLLEGTYNKLWLYDDSVYRWRYATLREVAVEIDPRIPLLAKYRFTWECQVGGWFDYAESTATKTMAASSYTPPAGPPDENPANTGTLDVFDCVWTVTAGGADITALEIKASGWEMDYAGTIATTKALVIDSGARSVLNDGTSDYANFSLGATHTIDEWSRITSGGSPTTITVTFTGGSNDSTIKWSFYPAYY